MRAVITYDQISCFEYNKEEADKLYNYFWDTFLEILKENHKED